MPKPVVVAVVYHPADPEELERKYPRHLENPGVDKLIGAARAVYAGNVRGDVNGKKATRTAIFVFPSLRVWNNLVMDHEVKSVVDDAVLIAGQGGVSIVVGEVDAVKEPVFDPRGPGSQN